jgi:hypothetical protein
MLHHPLPPTSAAGKSGQNCLHLERENHTKTTGTEVVSLIICGEAAYQRSTDVNSFGRFFNQVPSTNRKGLA